MSYILDALKKSEKERQRGTVPDLLTVQDTVAEKPEKRSLLPYLFLTTLLINALVLVWWIGPWHSKKTGVVVQSASKKLEEPKTPEASDPPLTIAGPPAESAKTADPEIDSAKKEPAPIQEPSIKNRPASRPVQNRPLQAKADPRKKTTAGPMPGDDVQNSQKTSAGVPRQAPENARSLTESESGINARPEPNRIYNLKELPQSIQQSLPAFTISVYLYSQDPASRMVRINGQTMREGQTLSEGLRLEEITSDAVVFSFQNYRFRVGPR